MLYFLSGSLEKVSKIRSEQTCETLLLLIWEPLCGESRPLQSLTEHYVVEEGSVLLPYLVFLVDHFVLEGLIRVVFPFLDILRYKRVSQPRYRNCGLINPEQHNAVSQLSTVIFPAQTMGKTRAKRKENMDLVEEKRIAHMSAQTSPRFSSLYRTQSEGVRGASSEALMLKEGSITYRASLRLPLPPWLLAFPKVLRANRRHTIVGARVTRKSIKASRGLGLLVVSVHDIRARSIANV